MTAEVQPREGWVGSPALRLHEGKHFATRRGGCYDLTTAWRETVVSLKVARASASPIEIRLLGPFEAQVGQWLCGPLGPWRRRWRRRWSVTRWRQT
jgi:hypothetical protein